MAKLDDDSDKPEENEETTKPKFNKKKVLLIVVPVLIIAATIVSFFTIFNQKLKSSPTSNYNIITNENKEDGKKTTLVFYDLPEISVQIKGSSPEKETLKMKISVEISDVNDIPKLEAMISRITDAIILHTVELTQEEVSGISGLYWLKEELLYRINLVSNPIKVTNLNFKSFEIQKPTN